MILASAAESVGSIDVLILIAILLLWASNSDNGRKK